MRLNPNSGLIYALSAYTLWGIVPVFWKQLDHVSSTEIVVHRMVWSCLVAVVLLVVLRQWRSFVSLLKQPELLLRLATAALLMALNWAIYIWAINSNHIVESSMGYFINPLINVLFGVLFFAERMRHSQLFSLGLAALGVLYLVIGHGQIPYIALSLALTFACYGAVKKTLPVSAVHGMVIETGFLIVPATLCLVYLHHQGSGTFGNDTSTDVMLMLGGLVTLAPYILFAAAAKKISLTALGMCQYIAPTLQLLIGVFIYHEAFGLERIIAFGLIWSALVIYTVDQLNHHRRISKLGI